MHRVQSAGLDLCVLLSRVTRAVYDESRGRQKPFFTFITTSPDTRCLVPAADIDTLSSIPVVE